MTIVVTITAILATVAMPNFMGQLRKARRWDAMVSIVRIQQSQERWRGSNATYADTVAMLATVDSSLTSSSEKAYYTLVTAPIANAAGTGYSVTATAATGSAQSADTQCRQLTITVSAGNATYAPENCWSK